ncbi:class I SAM-dependent DNA methyltransferase [Methylobacterium sp. sgz302541]|uniref:class I SAM-dependent DNA methyltransferase n=1 Tax=unclassified Methylobacterium TaxID=2615210 RepID=UPI003D34D956
MNAVEIEEAVSQLAAEPFDGAEFPFAFLRAFGNKEVTIKRLRGGSASDVPGGVLQRNNVHLAVCAPGMVGATLDALRASPKTAANRVKFALATDGAEVQAHDMAADDPLSCPFVELGAHFGFFLPLAGISTVRQIKDNPIDVKATGRLNKLYVELLRDNPDWASEAKRPELNRFMARLIFCFFAEDTGIFLNALFSKTIEQMSEAAAGNTHTVLAELFRAMATPVATRAGLRPWADAFPFVNGGLFSDAGEVPRFSRMARTYLLRAAELSWQQINPDIFGSMIQAVADDDERGALGMHYTSVPNILKVLNPLFLDELRASLEAAGDSTRKLRALRRRIGAVRVFDPACGSGNFLVIAYIRLREIEHEIVRRTGDDPTSVIPLTNFYGIEIKGFPAEIARLALLIAEFQCDARLISQQAARSMVLPLHRTGQIHIGNALQMDWVAICPPAMRMVVEEHDLGGPTGHFALEDNGAGEVVEPETYICGNPPYIGGKKQNLVQKQDMKCVFKNGEQSKNLDYVTAFIIKACRHLDYAKRSAIVSTNSVCQGTHVPTLWPMILELGCEVVFAYEPFKWANNAQRNAGVTCTIIGFERAYAGEKYIFSSNTKRVVRNISPYLVEGTNDIVEPRSHNLNNLSRMITGNAPYDGGHLFIEAAEASDIKRRYPELHANIRRVCGTSELVDGVSRYCFWFSDKEKEFAAGHPVTSSRISSVIDYRKSGGEVAVTLTAKPHQFRFSNQCCEHQILIPQVSSERREYLPIGFLSKDFIITHLAHAIYDGTLVDFSVLSSKLHLVWISTICGKLETRLRYASNLGWNTFPICKLTEEQKSDLTRCAEAILIAREAHFPTSMADLYDPERMPDDLRLAHEQNDEILERIYIGRRFRNDTERLEKLFQLYTKMAAVAPAKTGQAAAKLKPRRARVGAV